MTLSKRIFITAVLLLVSGILMENNLAYAFTINTRQQYFQVDQQAYSPVVTAVLSSSFAGNKIMKYRNPSFQKTSTCLKGLDYEAIENDEECDFGSDPNRKLPDKCIELPTPNASMTPLQVVTTCMNQLQNNDEPKLNSGLEVCYYFSSDACQAANGGSLEAFLQYANNPVFQSMVDCHEWEVVNVGPEIQGTNTRGAMRTVLIQVVQKKVKGQERNDRRFLWTLMKERRPPRQGCFLVHECISVENAFAHTI